MNSTAFEAILDVAIGMIFMWLILSIATMSIQEWIASFLKWRANDLEAAIQRLLGDKVWAEQLYKHPLIEGLSKKAGKKPSYIPANKFALALYDVVMSAGTQESFIQQRLLAANKELKKAPNQLFPFIGYVFKRFGNGIWRFAIRVYAFLGGKKGTPDQKYDELLELTQRLIHSNDPEKSENLAKSLKEIFRALLADEINKDGKTLSLPSSEFLKAYPTFRDYFIQLLKVVVEGQQNLVTRWAEIITYNNEKLVKEIEGSLQTGETLREKLHPYIEELAQSFNIDDQDIETVSTFVKQTLDEIDFIPMVSYIKSLIGSSTQGLPALQTLNPTLHKSLQQLNADFVSIANNTKLLDKIREQFADMTLKADAIEQNLQVMRLNSETWFNESMDRLSGSYKRKATFLAFLIGLALAAAINVDSITLAKHLWKEPAVRNALVANATEFANKNTEIPTVPTTGDNQVDNAVDYFNEQFKDLNIPLGWETKPVALTGNQVCRLIPIGRNTVWGLKDRMVAGQCNQVSNVPADSAGWFTKGMGIIFSAAAAAQGSPFWFDILKKLVNIRGAGANPDEKK